MTDTELAEEIAMLRAALAKAVGLLKDGVISLDPNFDTTWSRSVHAFVAKLDATDDA